jgi:hypothetical protein
MHPPRPGIIRLIGHTSSYSILLSPRDEAAEWQTPGDGIDDAKLFLLSFEEV